MIDILDAELQEQAGISLRWYDVRRHPERLDVLDAAPLHRDGLQRHFARHLVDQDVKALARPLGKVRDEVRPLRAAQIAGLVSTFS